MTDALSNLRRRAALFALAVLWLCCLVVTALEIGLQSSGWVDPALALACAGLASLACWRNPSSLFARMMTSAGLAVAVATIVLQLRGHPWQADAHMIFFAAFAITAIFCDWRPIVLFAALVAVHHLALNFLATAAVFPGDPSLGRVLMHAAVLILQAIALIWLAQTLSRRFAEVADLLGTADSARATADAARDEAIALSRRAEAEERASSALVQLLTDGIARLTAGETALRLPLDQVAAEHRDVVARFNGLAGSLRRLHSGIEEGAERLTLAADHLLDTARRASQEAGRQSQTLGTTGSDLRNLADGLQQSAAAALGADEKMRQNRDAAASGGAALSDAVAAMARIAESAGQIGQIAGVMEDIAMQTNLLALNAGVEASRANEAGRGFAVIAAEVRSLAQRATVSAAEIRQLVETSRQNVEQGNRLVLGLNDAIAQVIAGAESSATVVAGIAAQVNEQAETLRQTITSVTELERSARETLGLSARASDLSGDLRQDSADLRENFRQFWSQGGGSVGRVDTAAAAPPQAA